MVSKKEVPRDSQRSLDGPLSFNLFRSIREMSGRITRTPARLTVARIDRRIVACCSRQINKSLEVERLSFIGNLTLLYVQWYLFVAYCSKSAIACRLKVAAKKTRRTRVIFKFLQTKLVSSLVFFKLLHNLFAHNQAKDGSFAEFDSLLSVEGRGIVNDRLLTEWCVSGAKSKATMTAKNSIPELAKNGTQGFLVIVSPLIGVATISATRATEEK